jgi:small-conductance mechanosensitive channel
VLANIKTTDNEYYMMYRHVITRFKFIWAVLLYFGLSLALVQAATLLPKELAQELQHIESELNQATSSIPLAALKTKLASLQQVLENCQAGAERELSTLSQLGGVEHKALIEQKVESSALKYQGILDQEGKYRGQLIECKYYLLKVAQLHEQYITKLSQQRITDYWHKIYVYQNTTDANAQLTSEPGLWSLYLFYATYFTLLIAALVWLKQVLKGKAKLSFQPVCSGLIIVFFGFFSMLLHKFLNLTVYDGTWLLFSSIILLPKFASIKQTFSNKLWLGVILTVGMSNTLLLQTDMLWQVSKYWHGIIVFAAIAAAALLFILSQFTLGIRFFFGLALTNLIMEGFEYHALAHQMVIVQYLLLILYSLHYSILMMISSVVSILPLTELSIDKSSNSMALAQLNSEIPGVSWFKWSLYVSLMIYAGMQLLDYSGLPENIVLLVDKVFTDGVLVGTVGINPKNILSALFVLSNLLIICWLIRQKMERKLHQMDPETSHRQNAMAALFWYSAVSFSVLIALSISGFSVENLALIAGAFSVGIGFGLQNIVSNFVSGIILLVERPVKPNDWIDIGGTQGIVQKINIRATHIKTFDNSDILIPNSELISNQVRNLMFDDRIGRINLNIGVAYGSDTRLVQNLLKQVMLENKWVINHDANYPIAVLFKEFGDSSLNFQLKCFISDILKIYSAESELNFAIDDIFRQHQIEIPFPQRDIHFR